MPEPRSLGYSHRRPVPGCLGVCAGAGQHCLHGTVAFMAGVLEHLRSLSRPPERERVPDRSRVRLRVVDPHSVDHSVCVDWSPRLGDSEAVSRPGMLARDWFCGYAARCRSYSCGRRYEASIGPPSGAAAQPLWRRLRLPSRYPDRSHLVQCLRQDCDGFTGLEDLPVVGLWFRQRRRRQPRVSGISPMCSGLRARRLRSVQIVSRPVSGVPRVPRASARSRCLCAALAGFLFPCRR